jgi:large subunit ribosomal protein L3
MKAILGRKVAMTQYFDEEGRAHAATVVEAGPATVTALKTMDRDGYEAVQVGFGSRNEKNVSQALLKQWGDMGTFSLTCEFPLPVEMAYAVGDSYSIADVFTEGDVIAVCGTSKGKGFQGVVKRHNFAGGRRSHGQKHSEREAGSIGATGPARVFKGTRMAGRMGSDRVTVKNLRVLAMDLETNTLLIKGAVPGRRGTVLEITKTS